MKKVLCFGVVSYDKTFKEGVDGYPSEPQIAAPGGKPFNQATAMWRAGVAATIMAPLGKDEFGEVILTELKESGLKTAIKWADEPNNIAEIFVSAKGENDIHRIPGVQFTLDILDEFQAEMDEADVIVTTAKIPKEIILRVAKFCHENGKKFVITPSPAKNLLITDAVNAEVIENSWLITANEAECKTMFCTEDIEACVRKYPNKLIVTLGGDGVIFCDGESVHRIPAIHVDVVDTTGAGDTFCGNLIAALVNGYSMYDAVVRAQYSSAMKIQSETARAGMPWKDELDKFILMHEGGKHV